MKTTRLLLLPLLGLAVALSLRAAEPAKPESRAQVIFFEPEHFTDVKDSNMGSDKGRDAILEQLRTYIEYRANYYVQSGQKLTITVTDVDLAGDFEPTMGSRWQDIRVVKDIYPPRIDLSFKLTDAAGNTLKTGTRQLRDLAFMMKLSSNLDDTLRHEKTLLDDWFRADFPRGR